MVGTPASSREARQFKVYQSASIAAAFSALAMRPSKRELAIIAVLCILSASICGLTFWMEWSVTALGVVGIPSGIAAVMVRAAQGIATILVALSTTALWKALTLKALAQIITSSEATLNLQKLIGSRKTGSAPSRTTFLFENQRVLLGMLPSARKRKRCDSPAEIRGTLFNSVKHRPSWMHTSPSTASTLLVPVHPGFEKESSGAGCCNNGASTWSRRGSAGIGTGPSICPTAAVISPRGPFSVQVSSYPLTSHDSMSPGASASPEDHHFPSPWSKVKAHAPRREVIKNEECFAKFLADVDKHILGSAGRVAQTASPFLLECGVPGRGRLSSNASMNSSLVTLSGTSRSGTPPPRVFPLFSKGIAPPKFGESELPGPMSLDQFHDGLRQLGIFDYMEYWRDALRQWFSSILLKPLVHKLDTSHWQVMAVAAKLGITITVGQIGCDRQHYGEHVAPPATDQGITHEWLTPLGPDEDALMHQLRAILMQARDMRPTRQTSLFGLQFTTQEKGVNPAIQECLEAVTEHQRLRALMKGDWGKGLLPLSSMRSDYSVHRVRELADGTCAKQFDWSGHGADTSSQYNPEMPSDPHLLLYLFCALLEHPQWMLTEHPTEHPSAQWEVNPLYVAATPHKERIPDKYIAVLPHAPGYLHAGACVLCIGKQRPPVFALYWDRKLQFSFQGRSALWDALLLLCHRIKVAHGGVIRGIRLDSPALILNSVMDTLYPIFCS